MRTRTLVVSIQMLVPESASVKDLDEVIALERDRFPSAVWQTYVRTIEAEAEEQSGYALRRRGLEKRQLWTMCGQIEFKRQRYYYADEREPGTFMVFDNRIDLKPRQRFTPGAQEVYAKVASLAPSYKCASRIAELVLGSSPSDWWIWKRTQAEGKKLRDRDRQERLRVFQDGELPNANAPSKGFVGIEADATKIHAYKAKGQNHDLYMGIAYDGKERVGEKRNRLTNKVAVCGIYNTKEFGEDLFVAAQKHHNVADATAMLFSSDGERALESLRLNHFPQAEHQLGGMWQIACVTHIRGSDARRRRE